MENVQDSIIFKAQNKDKKAIEEILKIATPAIIYFAKRYDRYLKPNRCIPTHDIDDLKQIGRLGVLKAIDTWKGSSEEEVTFDVRCAVKIKHFIINTFRIKKQLPIGTFSIEALQKNFVNKHDFLEYSSVIVGNTSDIQYETKEEQELINKMLTLWLEPWEKDLVCLLYGLDGHEKHTSAEVAKIAETTEDTVRGQIVRIRSWLRYSLSNRKLVSELLDEDIGNAKIDFMINKGNGQVITKNVANIIKGMKIRDKMLKNRRVKSGV